MTDRPIIFSAPMVRALLDGRKSQTRRILKLPTKTHSGGVIYERPDMGGWEATTLGGQGCFTIGEDGQHVPAPELIGIWHRTCGVCVAAPYQPGDRLYVREALERANSEAVGYPADGTWLPNTPWRWKVKHLSGRYMPRAFSRLTLTVSEVRVERLQEISEADAIAEGCVEFPCDGPHRGPGRTYWSMQKGHPAGISRLTASEAFRAFWETLHTKPGERWEDNPWIVAISFSVEKRNIDHV